MNETNVSGSSTQSQVTKDLKYYLAEFDRICTEYLYNKAPFAIPENWRGPFVTIMAYLNVLGIVLNVFALVALLGLGTMLSALGAAGNVNAQINGSNPIFAIVFIIGNLVLSILAAPGLFKKQKKGWTYSYYNALLGIVQNAVTLNFVGVIVGGIINLYVLYQLRPKFVN